MPAAPMGFYSASVAVLWTTALRAAAPVRRPPGLDVDCALLAQGRRDVAPTSLGERLPPKDTSLPDR